MKAKHAIARVKNASIWQKIFCTLIAVTLLALMIPNGLRANADVATEQNVKTENKANLQEEVNKNLDMAETGEINADSYVSSSLIPKLGSSVTFDKRSLNMDKTNGYFTVQTAKVTAEQLGYFFTNEVKPPKDYFNSLTMNENGEIKAEDLAGFFAQTVGAAPFIPFDELDFTSEDVYDDTYTVHMEDAVEIPEFIPELAENLVNNVMNGMEGTEISDETPLPFIALALMDVLSASVQFLKYLPNTIIPSNTDIGRGYIPVPGPVPFGDGPFPGWPFTNDGSVFMFNFYLGQGNFIDMLKGAHLTITRVMPVFPTTIPDVPDFRAGNLNSSNGEANSANVEPYFASWDFDLNASGYSMPLMMLQQYYGDVRCKIVEPNVVTPGPPARYQVGVAEFQLLNYAPLPIKSMRNVHATANFWDIEGLVAVTLDFDNAYVDLDMRSALRADGWRTSDFVGASKWTKYYWEDTPTMFVYGDFFNKFGAWIFGGPSSEKFHPTSIEVPGEASWNFVYKDEIIRHDFFSENPYFEEWEFVPFPGPHWFETDNENWAGTIDKDTTMKFSVYPVSPRGHVVHQGQGDNVIEQILNVADTVNKANVMMFDENDMPLFSYFAQHYDSSAFQATWNESGYYFGWGENSNDEDFVPAYCYDTQIDHAIIYAWDEDTIDADHPSRNIYVPLRVDMNQFDPHFATLFDYGYVDFSVERMMFADVIKYASVFDGVDSYQVEYFEDGNLLADPYTISNPWELAWFGLPMVTNGTITTWRNTLVTGYGCFMDFKNPFGDFDRLNAFKDQDNFTVSNTQHWYQCRITANMKPGYEFNSWFYDRQPISADVEGAGEEAIIIKEPGILINHEVFGTASQVAAVENTDETAIYGDDADGTAIYGAESVAPVAATPDGNAPVIAANPTADGAAQTGDSMGFAFAILALVVLAAGITATRKIMVK